MAAASLLGAVMGKPGDKAGIGADGAGTVRRILLTIAYDGTDYCGWQIQKNGVSIEEVLTKAVRRVTREETYLLGASRTDAGVHALGNVVAFDTAGRIPGDVFARAVNTFLPDDIRVRVSREVPVSFHPRYADSVKTYEYYVLNTADVVPTERRTHWYVTYPLDLDRMREAAALFVGQHDFASFCCPRTNAKTTVREVTALDIDKKGDLITFHVEGTGFLYNMVRIMVGTLVRVGRGFYGPERVAEIMEEHDRRAAGATAPPQGLFLIGIRYPGDQPGQDSQT